VEPLKQYDNKKKRHENPILKFLRNYNLLNNKHIPDVYLYNSREVRLAVLAGLMDSDGSLAETHYDFIQKNVHLSYQIVFLARSLGFACFPTTCQKTCTNAPGGPKTGTYIRMTICGDRLDELPCVVPRKQAIANTTRNEDVMVTGFQIEPLGEDFYYDLRLDGNHKYYHGDFIVAHDNTPVEDQ